MSTLVTREIIKSSCPGEKIKKKIKYKPLCLANAAAVRDTTRRIGGNVTSAGWLAGNTHIYGTWVPEALRLVANCYIRLLYFIFTTVPAENCMTIVLHVSSLYSCQKVIYNIRGKRGITWYLLASSSPLGLRLGSRWEHHWGIYYN